MKPAQISFLYNQFMHEVAALKGDALLDRWIVFEDSPESKEPDLGVLKSNCLEVALTNAFGFGQWQNAVRARRKAIFDTQNQ